MRWEPDDAPGATGEVVMAPEGNLVLVTGQIVSYNGMVTVVTCGPAGQFVTVGAQLVTV